MMAKVSAVKVFPTITYIVLSVYAKIKVNFNIRKKIKIKFAQ
jgi:hypothetical protein